MAGRKPVPTQLKILKGTDQKCRIRSDEPKPKKTNIKMPSDLSATAKKHWRLVCKQLSDAGIMTQLDTIALKLYCESYARWKEANLKIDELGPIVQSPNGFPIQSPYLQIANKAFDQMTKLLTEFGMTPSSRTKVSVAPKDKETDKPWTKF